MSKSDKYSGACPFSALKTMTHVWYLTRIEKGAILILGTFAGSGAERVSLRLPVELYGPHGFFENPIGTCSLSLFSRLLAGL